MLLILNITKIRKHNSERGDHYTLTYFIYFLMFIIQNISLSCRLQIVIVVG